MVGHLDHDTCARLLNVHPPYELIGILPIGKPAELKNNGPKRRAISEFTHKERFGNING